MNKIGKYENTNSFIFGTIQSSNMEGSVYQQAHNRATPQTTVYETIYDRRGNVLNMQPDGSYPRNAARSEWYVQRWFRKSVIQTSPQ